jgi:hypothetical protein
VKAGSRPGGRRPVGGRPDDVSLAATSALSVPDPADVDLAHGTTAELESWLRAAAVGRRWYPQPDCPVCRVGWELAA